MKRLIRRKINNLMISCKCGWDLADLIPSIIKLLYANFIKIFRSHLEKRWTNIHTQIASLNILQENFKSIHLKKV